ncbi:MAG: transcriptional regulator, partial [Gammaproteobacteria bacterium]
RQRNASIYDAAIKRARLGEAVQTPHVTPGARHIYNQYVIRARERDKLRQYLTPAGVGTEIYYPVPLHLQQCFAYLGHKAEDYPQSERAARESLALPIYPELTETQLQYAVDTIASFYGG